MKKLIRQVLDELGDTQINLGSKASRETISALISAALKEKGEYKKYTKDELDVQKARETWVCEICGKNTFEVEVDYIGTGTNHLGCELEHEKRVSSDRRKKTFGSTPDRRRSDRREKNWSQEKHEEKVFNQAVFGDSGDLTEARIQANNDRNDGWTKKHYKDLAEKYEKEKEKAKKLIDKSVEDYERNKLSEEIVDDKEAKYIYESPDGGETIYRRKFGEDKRELVKNWEELKKWQS